MPEVRRRSALKSWWTVVGAVEDAHEIGNWSGRRWPSGPGLTEMQEQRDVDLVQLSEHLVAAPTTDASSAISRRIAARGRP